MSDCRIEYKDSFNQHTVVEVTDIQADMHNITDKRVLLVISKDKRVVRELLTQDDAFKLGQSLIKKGVEYENTK